MKQRIAKKLYKRYHLTGERCRCFEKMLNTVHLSYRKKLFFTP